MTWTDIIRKISDEHADIYHYTVLEEGEGCIVLNYVEFGKPELNATIHMNEAQALEIAQAILALREDMLAR